MSQNTDVPPSVLTAINRQWYTPGMHHQALLDKYSATVAETSRRDLTIDMAEYLTWLGQQTPTMETAQRWIKKMRSAGYADNTLKKEYETIRQLYKINGILWETKKGDAPKVNMESVWRPTLDPMIIKAMISVALQTAPAKKGLWQPDTRDICCLFLSTIWGPRRAEIAGMRPADINHKSSLIHINTLKGGRARWHWVPPDVMHFITDWGFAHPTSLTATSQVFTRWRLAVGIQTDKELGWHSIRHALSRGLNEAGVSPERRKQFMRWAVSSSDMGESYGTAPVVSFDSVRQELVVDEKRNDEMVLAVHPFLSWWRGE